MATSKFQKGPDLKRFMVCFKDKSNACFHTPCIQLDKVGRKFAVSSLLSSISISISSHIYALLCLFYYILLLFQDKRLKIHINGNRKLIGTLRGYDAFLNVVLEEVEQDQGGYLGQVVVRGNSIIQFEALERVN
jgi:small nuclear ribonucleoprotein G